MGTKPGFEGSRGDELPARLRRQRRKLGLTIDEAASLVGLRRWTWGLSENGSQQPHPRRQAALARFIGRR
jgi:DNA-binding XRE family transcriptional regulator